LPTSKCNESEWQRKGPKDRTRGQMIAQNSTKCTRSKRKRNAPPFNQSNERPRLRALTCGYDTAFKHQIPRTNNTSNIMTMYHVSPTHKQWAPPLSPNLKQDAHPMNVPTSLEPTSTVCTQTSQRPAQDSGPHQRG
jgi:hypothetical protein